MDVFNDLAEGSRLSQIKTIGMHTAGEPTRIVVQGYPELRGSTLLEKRAFAKESHDEIRKRLMFEPRGHCDMYGAILVQDTELTSIGAADIGVLFCHNEGYSTMCGHATIALGRFLIDTNDKKVFPRRRLLEYNESDDSIKLILHAPCGPVKVSVPVTPTTNSLGQEKSDPSRPVSFLSVPSFATAIGLKLAIPEKYRWDEINVSGPGEVIIDIAYGGAFYAIVKLEALGFPGDNILIGQGNDHSLDALKEATRLLKTFLTETEDFRKYFRHPTSPDLEYLYGVIVVNSLMPPTAEGKEAAQEEMGICFFADQQIDRSPCGSGVSARVALSATKGELGLGKGRVYHSLITKSKGVDAFAGSAAEKVSLDHDGRHLGEKEVWEAWVVKVEGKGYYTDATTFVWEQTDSISKEGFIL